MVLDRDAGGDGVVAERVEYRVDDDQVLDHAALAYALDERGLGARALVELEDVAQHIFAAVQRAGEVEHIALGGAPSEHRSLAAEVDVGGQPVIESVVVGGAVFVALQRAPIVERTEQIGRLAVLFIDIGLEVSQRQHAGRADDEVAGLIRAAARSGDCELLIFLYLGGIGAVAVLYEFFFIDELREHTGHGVDFDVLRLQAKLVVLALRQAVLLRRFVKAHTHRRGAALRRRLDYRMVVGLIRAAYRHTDVEVDGQNPRLDRILRERRPIEALRHGESVYLREPGRVGQVEVARLRREEQLFAAVFGAVPSARHDEHFGGGIQPGVDALDANYVGIVGQHRIGAHDLGDGIAFKRRCDAERSLVLAYRHRHELRALVGVDETYEVAVRVDKHGADRGVRVDDRHIFRLVRVGGGLQTLIDVNAAQSLLVGDDYRVGEPCRRVGIAVVILVGVDRVGCLGVDDQRDAVRDGAAAALYLVCDAVVGVEGDVADRRAASADHALDEGLGIVADRGAADGDFLFFAVHGELDGVLLHGAVVDDLFDGSGALGDDRGAEAAQRDDERAHALSGGRAVVVLIGKRTAKREHAYDAVEPRAYAAAGHGGKVADAVTFPNVLAHLRDRLDGYHVGVL